MQIFGHPSLVIFDPEAEFLRRSHIISAGTESELVQNEHLHKESGHKEIVEDEIKLEVYGDSKIRNK